MQGEGEGEGGHEQTQQKNLTPTYPNRKPHNISKSNPPASRKSESAVMEVSWADGIEFQIPAKKTPASHRP